MKISKITEYTRKDGTLGWRVELDGLSAPLYTDKRDWVEGQDYPIKVHTPEGKNYYVLDEPKQTPKFVKKDEDAIIVECAFKGIVELYKPTVTGKVPIADIAKDTEQMATHLKAIIAKFKLT